MNQIHIKQIILSIFLFISATNINGQGKWDQQIKDKLPDILRNHRSLVSIPNISTNAEDMYKNVDWVTTEFQNLGFNISLLESSSLPVLLAEKMVDESLKTVLFYMHLDGQSVDPGNWNQEHPFIPVLKEQEKDGTWRIIDWNKLEGPIDPEWRIFGRSAADDKAPIIMLITALDIMKSQHEKQNFNIKIILDLQEEAGSDAFLTTLEKNKNRYVSDYMIILDGPTHNTNQPALSFGCRGIAKCSISIYGAKLPQHSGHYGNYAPNPIFNMAHLLSSMKDQEGKVIIEGFYDGIEITREIKEILSQVPDNDEDIRRDLGINKPDNVGNSYQESLQYPSLNIRQIETSYKGDELKTVIPEIVTAHIDARLVLETDGAEQLHKIKKHIEDQGYLVLDRDPTDEERLANDNIAKFIGSPGVNAFRTEIDSPFGEKLQEVLKKEFNRGPVLIRTMGGTVPITPAVHTLNIPAVIVPTVNMDNNQHNPNENIRIGNISQGIKICLAILSMRI